jgi:periplasmic protein TonB
MKQRSRGNSRVVVGAVAVGIVLVLTTGTVLALKYLMQDDSHRRQRQIQMITLVEPPPPPEIKEPPPEPEIKKEEIIEPEPETPPDPADDMSQDDTPPGEQLGLDADGSAGSDDFGLKANRGGRGLIGGAAGDAALMRHYAWYTRIIQEELRKRMNRHMEQNGGIPEGELKALIQITLDDFGRIVAFHLAGASGDPKMDAALVSTLQTAAISEPPPSGMPRVIRLKISSKG